MPSLLGKRKARPTEDEKPTVAKEEAEVEDAQAILRRHFEARFKLPVDLTPLATTSTRFTTAEQDDEEDTDDEDLSDDEDGSWDGVSEDEDEPEVEVVDHTKTGREVNTSLMSKKELKAYLSSKPPTASTSTSLATTQQKKPENREDGGGDDEDSAAFLANDLALQRLISESHILSAAGGNSSHYLSTTAAENGLNKRAFAEGRTRKKTTDLRVLALGAKESMLEQRKMPMSMRKSIQQSRTEKEAKRRREAKENGIILERPQFKATKRRGGGSAGMRDKVDMPAVGKMRGAELRISARDVRAIESSGRGRGGGGRGGGKRGKR
ncbi:protein FAF1 [Diplogelasinospora grovesii]|uniref:Protein FAF1 n=1 Tax=Diplogelasinospora grovesii TaxID=303347 RepID=A0AAN6NBX6_9PEZI|nr:protein FAF1 [Diplogelasinospora grovesii]